MREWRADDAADRDAPPALLPAVLVGEPARPAIARRRVRRRRGQRRRPPVGDPRQQRRTGRREVRRAGAGDDDGHRAGLKRGAAHLPAATRAAGGGHRCERRKGTK